MLSLHKQLEAAKTPTDKTAIQRQIDPPAADQIDNLVYELYDLSVGASSFPSVGNGPGRLPSSL